MTITDISALAKCPTLQGKDNYTEWEEIMKSNLRTSGCWDIVSGDEAAPKKPDPFYTSRNKPSGISTLRQAEKEYARLDEAGDPVHSDEACKERVKEIKEQVAGYESYTRLKEKAKNLIMDSMTKDLWLQRVNKEDPKALWEELKKDYQKAGVPELGKELARFAEMNRSNHASPQALLNALKTQHSKIETTLNAAVFHPKYLSWRYIYEMNKYKPRFDIPLAKYDSMDEYPKPDEVKRALEAHLVNHPDIPKKPTAEKTSSTTPSQPGASVNTNVASDNSKKKRKRGEKGNKDNKSSTEHPVCPDCNKRHPGVCWVTHPELMPQHVRDRLQKKSKNASKGQ